MKTASQRRKENHLQRKELNLEILYRASCPVSWWQISWLRKNSGSVSPHTPCEEFWKMCVPYLKGIWRRQEIETSFILHLGERDPWPSSFTGPLRSLTDQKTKFIDEHLDTSRCQEPVLIDGTVQTISVNIHSTDEHCPGKYFSRSLPVHGGYD